MKIIHIFPYSARASGGHSNAIVEFIACQRATGLDVIGLSPLPPEDIHHGTAPAAGVREMDFTDPASVSAAIIRIADHQPAVMHVHAVNHFTGRLVESARRAGIAVVLTSHGQLNFRNVVHAVGKLLYLSLISPQVRHSDGIHVLTQKARQRLRVILPGYHGPVVVLPHTIHNPPVIGGHGNVPDATGPTREKPFTVISLGRLDVKTKGLDLLVKGFAKAGLPQAKLVLAGPDWQDGRAHLAKLAKDLGCAHQIEFPGAVYGADKEQLLAFADLYVAASRWDAFNISLAEALLRGVPAVVSERLNLAFELAQANAAEVVPCTARAFATAIRALSHDPIRRQNTACRGKTWVASHCSRNQVGLGFAAFYNNLPRLSHPR